MVMARQRGGVRAWLAALGAGVLLPGLAACIQCREDEVRVGNRCVQTCNQDDDCRAGEACLEGRCEDGTPFVPGSSSTAGPGSTSAGMSGTGSSAGVSSSSSQAGASTSASAAPGSSSSAGRSSSAGPASSSSAGAPSSSGGSASSTSLTSSSSGLSCGNGAWGATFPDLANAALGTLVMSSAVRPIALPSAQSATVDGEGMPELRLCTSSRCTTVTRNWTRESVPVTAGVYVQLRLTSADTPAAGRVATLHVGACSTPWAVTTAPRPDALQFPDVAEAQPATEVHSTAVRVTGLALPALVRVSGVASAQFRVCPEPECALPTVDWTDAEDVIRDQQYLQLRLTSAATGLTEQAATVDVGLGSASWRVTTANAPAPYDFLDQRSALPAREVRSNVVAITGVTGVVPVAVAGVRVPEYRLCGDGACAAVVQDWSAAQGNAASGQYLQLRLITADAPGTTTSAGVAVGMVGDGWTVTTASSPVTSATYTVSGMATGSTGAGVAGALWDGNTEDAASTWVSQSTPPGWIQANLPTVHVLTAVDLAPVPASATGGGVSRLNGALVQCSTNGTAWTDLVTVAGGVERVTRSFPVTASCRAVRVSKSTGVLAVGEFWLEGVPADNAAGPFDFTDPPEPVQPGQVVASNTVAVHGLSAAAQVSVSGATTAELRVCQDVQCAQLVRAWSAASATVSNGQYLQVRVIASSTEGVTQTLQVSLAAGFDTWNVTSWDHTPDAFTFANFSGEALDYPVQSAAVPVRGIVGSTAVSLTGTGEYRVCTASSCTSTPVEWTSGPALLQSGQYVQLRTRTSTEFNTPTQLTLAVGSGSASWTLTTMAADGCAGTPAPGTLCADGTVAAGTTPDGNVPLYTTRCDVNAAWVNGACTGTSSVSFNDGRLSWTATLVRDTVAGQANTAELAVLDASTAAGVQAHAAAQACAGLDGWQHADWYLPAKEELAGLSSLHAVLPGLGTSTYWSSSEVDASHAWTVQLSSGAASSATKSSGRAVRCVRVAPVDVDPDPLAFRAAMDAPRGVLLASDSVVVTGVAGPVPVQPDGMVPADFRVCGTVDCAVVSVDWTRQSAVLYNGQFLQLRTVTPALPQSTQPAVKVGNTLVPWNVSTMVTDPCQQSPAPGTTCADGTLFVGLSPEDGLPVFTAPCDVGATWDGAACTGPAVIFPWNNGNGTGWTATNTTSTTDGQVNQADLLALDADSSVVGVQPHQAARACGDWSAWGAADWYLPAQDELQELYSQRTALGGFTTAEYWSSTEAGTVVAQQLNFSTGAPGSANKNGGRRVRCVRR